MRVMTETARPSISVVTVVRNDLRGLISTTESVEKQIDVQLEHIIVDGAGGDSASLWLAEHKSTAARTVYISELDAGIFDAMNKGTLETTTDLVVFMNAGDTFVGPDVCAAVLRDRTTRGWRWGFGYILRTREKSADATSRRSNVSLSRFARGKEWIPHQAAFMPAELMRHQGGGYRAEFGVAADQELMVRLALISPPEYFDLGIANFGEGGAHSLISPFAREMLWYRIYTANYTRNTAMQMLAFVRALCLGTINSLRRIVSRWLHRARAATS